MIISGDTLFFVVMSIAVPVLIYKAYKAGQSYQDALEKTREIEKTE